MAQLNFRPWMLFEGGAEADFTTYREFDLPLERVRR